MEEKREDSSVNNYKMAMCFCIVLIAMCIVMFLETKSVIFIIATISLIGMAILFSDLSDKIDVIDANDMRIHVLTEHNEVLKDQIEELKKDLTIEEQHRISIERKIKQMIKQMEQAGILYISSDNKNKDTIPRKRRSKNNKTNNKAN